MSKSFLGKFIWPGGRYRLILESAGDKIDYRGMRFAFVEILLALVGDGSWECEREMKVRRRQDEFGGG